MPVIVEIRAAEGALLLSCRQENYNEAFRFLSRVELAGPEECWNWIWAREEPATISYGTFHRKDGPVGAHRAAWEIFVGAIPTGLQVLHTCDNRRCVNWTKHLFLGTIPQNMADKTQKGRQARGSLNGCSKLTEEQVREIKRRLAEGASQRALAKEFPVSQMVISRIANGMAWRHV